MKFLFNFYSFPFFHFTKKNSSKICFGLGCWFWVNNLSLQSLLSQFSFFFYFILSHHSLSLPLWFQSSSLSSISISSQSSFLSFISFLFRFISNHFWFSWLQNVWIASRSPESFFEQLRATPKAYFLINEVWMRNFN